ncbi:hypothetical protein Nepgr_006660 [Nepenthes gracilis]|uniref:Uncharacterized protein n=1 Tax=Nepenthes gracilis TaxID=150966 RepID=A0AAD3S5V5_NEPGR|nr:hypothetical protein Nepgr_006660 [Nepenthes gracilis]
MVGPGHAPVPPIFYPAFEALSFFTGGFICLRGVKTLARLVCFFEIEGSPISVLYGLFFEHSKPKEIRKSSEVVAAPISWSEVIRKDCEGQAPELSFSPPQSAVPSKSIAHS